MWAKRTTIWTVCWTSPDLLYRKYLFESMLKLSQESVGCVEICFSKLIECSCLIFIVDNDHLTAVFRHRYPLPVKSGFFDTLFFVWVSHNEYPFFYVGFNACRLRLPGIMVQIISIFAPQDLHVIFALCFSFLSIMTGLNFRIYCNNLIIFLLHGCRNP